MSAFSLLIGEAESLGVTKLTWVCDVGGWKADEQRKDRWCCYASGASGSYSSTGTNGEIALITVLQRLRGVAHE